MKKIDNENIVEIKYNGTVGREVEEFQKESYIPRSVTIDVYLHVYSPDNTERVTRVVSHILPIYDLFTDETIRNWIYFKQGVITDLSVMDAITGTITENVCQAFRDVYQNLGFEVDHIIVDLINEGDEEEDEEIGPNIKF